MDVACVCGKQQKQRLFKRSEVGLRILQNALVPGANILNDRGKDFKQMLLHLQIQIHIYPSLALSGSTVDLVFCQLSEALQRLHLVHHQFRVASLQPIVPQPRVDYASPFPPSPTFTAHLHLLLATALHIRTLFRPLTPPVFVARAHATEHPAMVAQRNAQKQVYFSPPTRSPTIRLDPRGKQDRLVQQRVRHLHLVLLHRGNRRESRGPPSHGEAVSADGS